LTVGGVSVRNVETHGSEDLDVAAGYVPGLVGGSRITDFDVDWSAVGVAGGRETETGVLSGRD